MRTCVIFNPTARGEKARKFRAHLDLLGGTCALKLTAAAGDGRTLATEAVREGFTTLVAAGGDGTLNEVVNGLAEAPGGLTRARLGVLPLGTVNVFAKELGLPTDLATAWEVIERGGERTIDLAQVEFGAPATRQCRHFVQLAGAGLDARAIELVDWNLKKKIGPLAYVVAGLRALRGAQTTITVQTEAATLAGELVLIGNGRLYGGSFELFPRAALADGLLDVCVFPRANWRTLAACGSGVLTGHIHRWSGARHLQARSLTLQAPARVALEVEGDLVGELPATFSVRPGALRVIVP